MNRFLLSIVMLFLFPLRTVCNAERPVDITAIVDNISTAKILGYLVESAFVSSVGPYDTNRDCSKFEQRQWKNLSNNLVLSAFHGQEGDSFVPLFGQGSSYGSNSSGHGPSFWKGRRPPWAPGPHFPIPESPTIVLLGIGVLFFLPWKQV